MILWTQREVEFRGGPVPVRVAEAFDKGRIVLVIDQIDALRSRAKDLPGECVKGLDEDRSHLPLYFQAPF